MPNSNDIFEQLKAGNKEILNVIYREHRGKFIGWAAKKFSADETTSIEIFQDAVVTLYENIHNGKLTDFSSSVQSYLFGIGRNKLMERSRYNKRYDTSEEALTNESIADEVDDSEDDFQNKLDLVVKTLKKMGPPCSTLLQYFYFEKKSMDEIAVLMAYKNPATAKNQKYKCFTRLKKLVFES